MADGFSIYQEPFAVVQDVNDMVSGHIDDAFNTAAQLRESAIAVMQQLGQTRLDLPNTGSPQTPSIAPITYTKSTVDGPSGTTFGDISYNLPNSPQLSAVPTPSNITISDFSPSITGFTIPDAPVLDSPGQLPASPGISEVQLPAAPSITIPPAPTLDDIKVPEFTGLSIPAFSASAPEFEGSALPQVLEWSEPSYVPAILSEAVSKIRNMWDGGSGLPPAVEQAIMERAAEREELITERQISSVSSDFSNRGFTTPSGMQAAREDQMRKELATKQLGLNREITIQIAQWQIENMRFAIQQAIATESVFVQLYTNMAQRMFDAAKTRIDQQLQLYNMQVALFNAKMGAYQVEATVFRELVAAELAKVQVFQAQVQAEVARGQINSQRVEAYTAQVQALNTRVAIYNSQMQGAEIEANVQKARIEGFQAEVSAYAARVSVDKNRLDAYTARVQAEASKAGIIDAEAKAYAAMVQGKTAQAEVDIKRIESTIESNKGFIQQYMADIDAEKASIAAQVAVIDASAKAYTADTQRYAAEAAAESSRAQIEVSAQESTMRSNIAFYQAQVQAYTASTEQLIRKAALVADSLKAAGEMASTLAAGAMAAVHVGASLSGSGGVTASGSASDSVSHSYSESTTTTYEGT